MSEPIFIHGIYPRSGTNHLHDLLCLHPDCAAPAPIWEDHLLTHADHLERYVAAVRTRWDPNWGDLDAHAATLLRSLGDGLGRFLGELAAPRRVVAKTPRVDRLGLFGALFPRASLLVLVRDGRAVVESGVRSFGWSREYAMRGWADAACEVLAFDAAQRGSGLRYRIVHYEDLVAEPEREVRALLDFLDLDAGRYDFAKLESLPVRGSSTLRRGPGDRVHWQAVARSADFDPLRRAGHWSRGRRARFDWLAGDALRALGYAQDEAIAHGPAGRAWNRLLDLGRWGLAVLRPLPRAWRRLRSAQAPR